MFTPFAFFQTSIPTIQNNSRLITTNGGATGANVRYIDLTPSDLPASIISTTASFPRRLGNFGGAAYSADQQRVVVFHNAGGGRNDLISFSNDYGINWSVGTFSSRQARGGLYVSPWSKWAGFGLTGSGSPFTGQMFDSTDGRTFTLRQSFTSTNIYFSHSAYSSTLDILVAANAGTATKNCCYWTKDATTWYAGTFSGTSFNPNEAPVLWQGGNNLFLCGRNGTTNANSFAISSDGKLWDPITATGISPIGAAVVPLAMAHNPRTGRTIVGLFSGNVSGNVIYYSDNGGYNWTLAPVAAATYYLESARYDSNTNTFVIGTRYFATAAQGFFMSKDGVNWTFYNQLNAGVPSAFMTLP
mgnify:CR=1 FL=1